MTNDHIPRNEYPRPQLVRKDWINLNGEWEFEIDASDSGKERKLYNKKHLSRKIVVPFCPESKLSRIENRDFMNAVWYKREFSIPSNWRDKKILLHFGAVDYETEVWINGHSVGTHVGGYTPFTFDITETLNADGGNTVTVYAKDDIKSRLQPCGKQALEYHSNKCRYTRTTGIWQTVWLEAVPLSSIDTFKIISDIDNNRVTIDTSFQGDTLGYSFKTLASYEGRVMGETELLLSYKENIIASIDLSELYLWEPGDGKLYDLQLFLLRDNEVIDEVTSYFGMREIAINKQKVLINGKSVFQRLVLDQGYYPDGVYTAPTEADLKKDIELAIELGFNGARLHEKVFEPRYLYWADRLGFMVWGEYADWGFDFSNLDAFARFLPEWLESVDRDFNHPSIVGWCPLNEIQGAKFKTESGDSVLLPDQNDHVVSMIYRSTKRMDNTRPVIDVSGFFHVETDIFDAHLYDQDPESFAEKFEDFKHGGKPYISFNYSDEKQKYEGQPYMLSEYGGIFWAPGETLELEDWEAGKPKTKEEFMYRYDGITKALLEHPNIFGFCYTQLYDIEQEKNGLYTYDRRLKFDKEAIKRINSGKAAIEENTDVNK
ncbi:hydrolase [Bacillus sp. J14TS2]|uniref:glycoside hydrolase family 2 protein n=1 Tax=Bacillus sp. J14TS2 TaxID=2807188 RepID=UPI001B2F72AA|nr:sugar-binding domain-containing protein [Bacillus sp. J14TS2]GIN69580.1 hydrolase [Bacillus sp. J14TS2]